MANFIRIVFLLMALFLVGAALFLDTIHKPSEAIMVMGVIFFCSFGIMTQIAELNKDK